MESTRMSSEPFELRIDLNALYNRAWLLANYPGMHNDRLGELQKTFGMIPLNSGNRHAPFLYRGKTILEALEREAIARYGNFTPDGEAE